jgi:deoxyribonuclease V
MIERAGWPATAEALVAAQRALAQETPPPWVREGALVLAASSLCSARGAVGPGRAGDEGWAGAALWAGGAIPEGAMVERAVVHGTLTAPFEPGLLALREGPLLEAVLRQLSRRPDVVLLNATGRDHPRRAGLALHLGAMLDVPTVGITRRPLHATGPLPAAARGARSPLSLDGECVAYWLRTRTGAQPIVVHGGWRIDPETAVELVLAVTTDARTPEPLREARRLARTARAS